MSIESRPRRFPAATHQRGQAMLLTVLLLGVGVAAVVYNFVTPAKQSIERDRTTAAALAQAKAALIGFAAGVNLAVGTSRPGDLPCPDVDNDGDADAVPACDTAALALGRLPWKTLDLPDLRDGDGERLWYAVSSNFKNNTRTPCVAPGDVGCLNSDSRGRITVRNSAGNVIHDGTFPILVPLDEFATSGAIAVIFAPGAVLQRQAAASAQDRSCTVGVNCDAAQKCTTTPASLTPRCNPVNYLDVLSGVEDNADFIDGSVNGFINGVIRDAANNVIVNDRLLVITYQDLMPLLERRVAKEAFNCLNFYAADPLNKGRYPWASNMFGSSGASPYSDTNGERFGRIPDDLTNTMRPNADAQSVCSLPPASQVPSCMSYSWPPACTLRQGSWWGNWKNLVLYAIADAYKPASNFVSSPPLTIEVPPGGPCGSCLIVNPPSAVANKRVVVMVAGKRLGPPIAGSGGQQRNTLARKSVPENYVESENDWINTSPDLFRRQAPTSSFNDTVLYFPFP